MEKYFLAIDIGASSGRHMLACKREDKIVLQEIYRFSNGMKEKEGHLIWDVDHLFFEILTGMKKCVELHKIPYSMSIDTWGVDYVLLDKEGNRLGNVNAYRDNRTKKIVKEVYDRIDETELYERTGIQKQAFNTIFQLMADKCIDATKFSLADKLLMIPDYFHYLLTGKAVTEYTNATTTQLVSPITKDWDMELIEQLGYPKKLFQPIKLPGYELGTLTEQIQKEVGFNCNVVLPATHDTGSAVLAVPSTKEAPFYISSGTWSLIGTELLAADCSNASRVHNLTNEGGYDYRFRYLKNIMGLWMIQSVRRELAEDLDFGTICEGASKCKITSIVDCNEERFLAPKSMAKEVQTACRETNQEVPEGIFEIAAVIYNSLAVCYANAKEEIEELTGTHYDTIHILGGGANAEYLNELTAKATGCPVLAGPTEATAIGNIAAQMITSGELEDLTDARNCIYESFPIKQYEPQNLVTTK